MAQMSCVQVIMHGQLPMKRMRKSLVLYQGYQQFAQRIFKKEHHQDQSKPIGVLQLMQDQIEGIV